MLIQRSPFAGEALIGGLIGYRKLTVGNRHWRIVWRVLVDDSDAPIVEIAEVWAIGARTDSVIYNEVRRRITRLGDTPEVVAIRSILERFAHSPSEFEDASSPIESPDPVPPWLADRLEKQIGMSNAEVTALSGEVAMGIWEEFITKPKKT